MNALADLPKIVAEKFSHLPIKTDAELDEWNWNNVVRPHLFATKLPYPYFWKIEVWNEQQKKVYRRCCDLLKQSGSIIALVGPRGIGKTTIAAQILIDRASDDTLLPIDRRPPYRKASELVAKFKPLFADFGTTKTEYLMSRLEDYSRYSLLVIDEWHECEELKMRDRVMTDLLDRRYSRNVDTILISNQTADQFFDSTNESTISRLSESGEVIRCEWESFRSK